MTPVQWYNPTRGIKSTGAVPAIVVEAERTLHVVLLDTPVRFMRVPKEEARRMRPITLKGRYYPVSRAIKIAKSLGRKFGISKAAKDALKAVAA